MGFIAIILVNMLTSNLAGRLGWTMLSVIYAIVATIMLLITSFFCKERKHLVVAENSDEPVENKVTFREGLPWEQNSAREQYW
ncbi:MAG: hypothetical protein LUC41_03890 [Clostridiales bacterium]|nr:hypothetical protein [Clostridiales bacterium]